MKKFSCLVLALMLPSACFAAGYSPLKIGTALNLPREITNVGQAAQYLLEPIGYKVVVPNEAQQSTLAILNRPVSPVAAKYGLTTIENALLVLIGEDSRLVVDYTHKLISFEPLPGGAR